jgi:chromosome segregation ATPase
MLFYIFHIMSYYLSSVPFRAPMDSLITNEKQLIADIDQLREKYPNTQELYREVCTVMFFRYGITPTANKLYQFVKKGSMSAPAEALGKFWENLREKSRVRIEHPDLPHEIKTSAGELAATLWDLAQDKAAASLHGYEAEARASVMEAKTAQANAEAERNGLRTELDKATAEIAQARGQIGALQQQMAAEAATREMLDEQLTKAQSDIAAHRQAQESARQYFATEMEKLRNEAQLAEERYRATEKRALLEIDRERSAAAKLQKEMDTVRADAAKAAEQYRLEAQALQEQLGGIRHQAGMLEGQLHAAKANSEQTARDFQVAQRQLIDAAIRAAALESERDGWRIRAEEGEKAVAELKERVARPRVSKKPGVKTAES